MAPAEDTIFEKSIEKFVEASKLSGLTDIQIQESVRPLVKEIRRQINRRILKMVLKLTVVLAVIFFVFFCTPLYFHLRAMGRIGLIKIKPYWDWNRLYYESCLVKNSVGNRDNVLEDIECTTCEDLKGIEGLQKVESKLLYENYITQEVPVIISDGAASWRIFHDQDFWFGNISQAYEKLFNQTNDVSFSCHFVSNLRIKSGLEGFFKEIYEHPDKPFFAHWENCDKPSMKVLRQFYERPYFISAAVDISFSNWILISSLYEGNVFREIQLDANLALIAQIRGFNHFELTPHKSCSRVCRSFQVNLEEGEILVVSSSFWNVKYQPGENSDNLAFIIQGEMD